MSDSECWVKHHIDTLFRKIGNANSKCELLQLAVCRDSQCTSVITDDSNLKTENNTHFAYNTCIAREPADLYLGVITMGGTNYTQRLVFEVCGWEQWVHWPTLFGLAAP